ncbi:MAG: lysostaphin resistance A-like protein [Haloferacaceae archaeon]
MPDWSAFAGVTGVVLTLLLVLARLSQNLDQPAARGPDAVTTGAEPTGPDAGEVSGSEAPLPWERALGDEGRVPRVDTGALLANVAVSQGGLGALLLFGAWYAEIPPAALGLDTAAFGPAVLLAGVAAGVGLYLANEGGAALGRRVGLDGAEAFRAMLAPETRREWVVLLLLVLPVVAGFEELLFRAALVGGLAAGFGVSPWLLAALSSVAFALGHGAQGRVGMVVTGVLGFALAALFVVTESLPAVVVAHYLVNALEFVVNER